VSALQETLQGRGLETLVWSIDDLYLRHEDQVKLAEEHKDNALVQHRGEPGWYSFSCPEVEIEIGRLTDGNRNARYATCA
jgi:pantothenate kinase-related protein Tda10